MKRTTLIPLVIVLIAVSAWTLIVQPWRVDKVTVVSQTGRINMEGRVTFKRSSYVVRVPAHTVKEKKTENDTILIVDRYIPTQRLVFPVSAVSVIVIE